MPISPELQSPNVDQAMAHEPAAFRGELNALLERAYGVKFTILDGQSGEVVCNSPDQPARDWAMRAEVCREVARRGRPALIDDDDPLLTLALPASDAAGNAIVAVATFLSRRLDVGEDLSAQAELLGMQAEDAVAWARRQPSWTADALQRISDIVLDDLDAQTAPAIFRKAPRTSLAILPRPTRKSVCCTA